MKRRYIMILAAAFAVGVILPLLAAFDGTPVTSSEKTFCAYVTEDATYSLANVGEIAAWLVTWREGETVSATAMDGAAYTLAEDAASTGSDALPAKGGIWTLANSEEGIARVAVPWSVYQGGGVSLASGVLADAFAADTVHDGPNRRLKDRQTPPVAYSGDDWAGDVSAMSTLTITPPAGSGIPTSYSDVAGEGCRPFTFNKAGRWTVTLAMEDGTTRTAVIGVVGGLIISFF